MVAELSLEVRQRALRLNEELAENRLLANDDRDAAEQDATIITGKWSDPEAQGDNQLTSEPS
jgi:hypothetical protein